MTLNSVNVLAQCSEECTHGSCTRPIVCICTPGWNRTSCATGNITLIKQLKYEVLTCVFKYHMAAEHWHGFFVMMLLYVGICNCSK